MNFFESLEKRGVTITSEQKKAIEERFTRALEYAPVIGIFGKTGVGKSSLCNSLFGQDVCPISDVKACTRSTQEVLLDLGEGKGITLLDVPGVGETGERDEEYAELYAKLLPEIDLVLWVLKADDRAFSSDEKFYKEIVKPHIRQGKPFYFVLNQVDKIEPYREWDIEAHKPGVKQFSNIGLKIDDVAQTFSYPKTQVLAVSANEKYNLVNLMDTVIYALPNAKRVTVYCKVPNENRSEKQEMYAKEGLRDEITAILKDILGEKAAHESEEVAKEEPDFLTNLLDTAKEVIDFIGKVWPRPKRYPVDPFDPLDGPWLL
jgi:small GTP-binding protein